MIINGMKTMIWAILMLGMVIYVFAVYFIEQVSRYRRISGPDAPHVESLGNWFYSMWWAQYTLYMCITGGIDWGDVSVALLEIHWLNSVLLSFYIFFVFFSVMNILTGIFVESTMDSARNDREQAMQDQMSLRGTEVKQLEALFRETDQDGSGQITLQVFEEQLKGPRISALFRAVGIEVDEARGFFHLLDTSASQSVDIQELTAGCLRLKGTAKAIDLATLLYENKRMSNDLRLMFFGLREKLEAIEGVLSLQNPAAAKTP